MAGRWAAGGEVAAVTIGSGLGRWSLAAWFPLPLPSRRFFGDTMRIVTPLASLLLLVLVAAAPSAKTHYYVVEYQKTVKGGVPQIQVTFYVAVKPETAEKILRREFETILELEKPTEDVLGTAWDGVGKAAGDEDQIDLPSGQIVYRVKSGKVEKLK